MKVFRHLAIVVSILTIAVPHSYAQTASQPFALSLTDAIDRGLHYNLAVLSGTQEERAAAAQRLRALYEMYPKLSAELFSTQQQINLAAFGFGGFPGQSQIVGPFALVDARAKLTQSVFDRKLVHDLREAQANEKAASYGNENTREIVVLTIANFYLQALAGSSRITAVTAQLERAQVLFSRATDLKNTGLIAGIDVLRAQVELQTQQQRLLAIQNDFALQKLNLSRAIGLPLSQEITLTDHMPSDTPATASVDAALQAARDNRADVKRARALLQAAQHAVDAAGSENLPTLEVAADYGAIGRTPGQSHGTYSMTGRVRIPLFNSNKRKSDQETAAARFEQRRLESQDLDERVEMDVRSAFLNIRSSEEQVKVAESSLDLSRKQLDQAQDRFEAGVSNNLEVVQAQEAVALADENRISNLYSLNVAKAILARAMGTAERTIKTFLGGKP